MVAACDSPFQKRMAGDSCALHCYRAFMATISKLQPGQVLYQIQRQKCGNTMVSRGCLYEVRVVSIADDGKSIMASWNGNPPRRFSEKHVANLRVKKPQPKGKVLGMDSY
jgi:hypothetical protein